MKHGCAAWISPHWCCLVLVLMGCTALYADSDSDAVRASLPFVQLVYQPGAVLPTNDFAAGAYPGGRSLGPATYVSVQYGWHLNPTTWQYHKYGGQFQGFGLRYASFGDSKHLGNPITVYYFQGGHLFRFSRWLKLAYNVEMGLTNGWKRYEPKEGYWNDATGGSFMSAMIGTEVMLACRLSNRCEVEVGGGVSHFSNGAFSLPNMGLNMVQSRVAMRYYLYPTPTDEPTPLVPMPALHKGPEWDVTAFVSKRQRYLKESPYAAHIKYDGIDYFVANVNVAAMFQTAYLLRVGPSAELMYDESCGVNLWLNQDQSGVNHSLAPFLNRINVGVGAKAELKLPLLSFWAQLGYNVVHQSVANERFYQVVGAKCPINTSISLVGGVRACSFKVAQCMFVGVQYSIKQLPN